MSNTTSIPINQPKIPILLLKTRSQPHDTYEEYFSNPDPSSPQLEFQPTFIPVLEHEQKEETLNELGQLLKSGRLKERYGGMIFTSQRAVEAWSDTVLKVEKDIHDGIGISDSNNEYSDTNPNTAVDERTGSIFLTDILTSTPFPLYVVGPATERALQTLISTVSQPSPTTPSPFLTLQPQLHGSHTGSGAVLAPFILSHYNTLQTHKMYTFHDAPRLPFIPLLGMGSENYSRRRLSSSDPRLQKKPLLFLVGETRRDIIPKTLMDHKLEGQRVEVDEVEVYSTVVRREFRAEFEDVLEKSTGGSGIVVVVVFSPQGCGDMLGTLGLVDSEWKRVEGGRELRWDTESGGDEGGVVAARKRHVIVTIGPTTRDFLRDEFGIEPDVCAKKPSPEGIGEGVRKFLEEMALVR